MGYWDPNLEKYVDPQIAKQRARTEAQRARELEEEREYELEQQERFDHITTLKDVNDTDFITMRKRINYDMAVTSTDSRFIRKEQELIFKELYSTLAQPVCPMRHVNFEKLMKKEYFHDAVWICQKLGLQHLMELDHPYSIEQIQQFYATVVFGHG